MRIRFDWLLLSIQSTASVVNRPVVAMMIASNGGFFHSSAFDAL
jgi:hypothetical protein